MNDDLTLKSQASVCFDFDLAEVFDVSESRSVQRCMAALVERLATKIVEEFMSEKATLPPGILPNITDTDPPPIHEDTVYGPPSCETVPMVSLEGATLSCTMGTWTSKPTLYRYQWQIDGDDVGDNAPTYETGPSEQGKQAVCIVTATNELGSTVAPPSNAVTVEGATRRRAGRDDPEAHPDHPEHRSWLERMRRHPENEREHPSNYAQERGERHK